MFKNQQNKINRLKKRLPYIVGETSINFFKDSWQKQGWENKRLSKWKPRKKRDSGRAILVKEGILRRDFQLNIVGNNITIINNRNYASIHNRGSRSRNIPKRQFMGKSYAMTKKTVKIVVEEIEKAVK